MLRPTIRHRTVQPRDSGRLAPPTESHGGRPSIPAHNYAIFPISLTRRMCFSNRLTIHKVIIKFGTAVSSRIGRANCNIFKLLFHTVVQQGFKKMAKNITYILWIIYCCFQRWKNFQNWLTVDEVIAKSSTPRFFSETQCILYYREQQH